MTIEASGTLKAVTKIQDLHTLARGELLRQFVTLSAEVKSAGPGALKYIILDLVTYFSLVNALYKQKRAMHHVMINPRGLKVIC